MDLLAQTHHQELRLDLEREQKLRQSLQNQLNALFSLVARQGDLLQNVVTNNKQLVEAAQLTANNYKSLHDRLVQLELRSK